MVNNDALKIPLIISVAGHIDITTPESVLQGYFSQFWKQLRDELGESTPFILLSSLAAGADHLAVKYRPADVQYCAVLPFAQEQYEKDFTGSAADDFRRDLQGAFKCVICDGSPGDYAKAAAYIRTHSDIIVTLWDGMETLDSNGNPSQGGTYYTVRKTLRLDKLLITYPEKAHLLVNFPVVRKKTYVGNEKKFFDSECWGTLTWDECSRKIQIAPGIVFPQNSDITRNIENIRNNNNSIHTPTGDRNYLYNDFANNFPEQFKIIEKDFLRYEYFDKIATENQAYHKKEFLRIALISIIAGLLGQIWGDATFSSDSIIHEWIIHGIILLYFISCISVFLYYLNTKKQAHYEKYIQPRAIAELMKLNIFWKLSSIKEEFFEYLLSDCSNFWRALPICNWEIASLPLSDTDKKMLHEELLKNLPAIQQLWIKDQKDYYKEYILSNPHSFFRIQADEKNPIGSRPRNIIKFIKKYFKPYHRINGYISFFKKFFFWSGFGLAALLLLIFSLAKLNIFTCLTDHVDFLNLGYYREFAIGLCPFIVATLGWLLEKNQWNVIGKRYSELYDAFGKAEKQLATIEKAENKQELIKELVLLCYLENSDWGSIKEENQPEPMF